MPDRQHDPPDFTNFYKPGGQQGLNVKACMVGKCLLFPQSVDALGDIANGLIKELWWHRTFPFTSSLTGETCAQLADDFEAKTGEQQTAPLLHYVVGEMAVYAIQKATDPKSKDALLAAIETMKFDSLVGTIDFTAPIIEQTGTRITDWPAGPGHKTKNVYDHGLGAPSGSCRVASGTSTRCLSTRPVPPRSRTTPSPSPSRCLSRSTVPQRSSI